MAQTRGRRLVRRQHGRQRRQRGIVSPSKSCRGPPLHPAAGGLSGALMSLVIFALFLIFIVTMTARYLRAGQPAPVPQLVTAAVASRNLTFHDNGTARPEQEEVEPAVAAAGNLTLLEAALQPAAAANRSS
ncbi:hypothetical protein MTO96_021844 [Rhipicephalus appendiculatus]